MVQFYSGVFAIAGAAAAAGPVIIHLLNRRRFRVIDWAAMDFLRQALQRSRRILQLRDLLLLFLRMSCLLLFGAALARPFFSGADNTALLNVLFAGFLVLAAVGTASATILTSGRTKYFLLAGTALLGGLAGLLFGRNVQTSAESSLANLNSRQPVHAVLLIDNSLSMGYETIDGTLLDKAKTKAAEFIDDLPADSRTSVIPVCGSEFGYTVDAYRAKQDAREALERISVVARQARVAAALELAAQACQQVPELPAKRVVYLGDQQRNSWPSESLSTALEQLPELQVVKIDAEQTANVWISDFRVQDGIADVETPTAFVISLSYTGTEPLTGVEVMLQIDGTDVVGQTVDLEPQQTRNLQFKHQFSNQVEPGQPVFVPAKVTVTTPTSIHDGLKLDNERYLSVPVVAALPVVFIDQYGKEEDPDASRVGETYRLRRLMAPRSRGDDSERQLVRPRHLTIDELDRSNLEDARLVVIAGVRSPGSSVSILREYVQQGGQLVILAGDGFDPAEWSRLAWLDGAGILPAPLDPVPVGESPEVSLSGVKPFYLEFASMQHDYFRIESESETALADLYRLPIFFKAVAANTSEETVAQLLESETDRIQEEQEFLAKSDENRRHWTELEARGLLGPEEEAAQKQDFQRRSHLEPSWLLWSAESVASSGKGTAKEQAARSRPVALANYTKDELPFLLERRVGSGRTLLFTSGAYSSWNTLTTTNAILVFDRILRSLLESTVPQRSFSAGDRIVLPAASQSGVRYLVERPGGYEESLEVEAIGPNAYGVTIRHAYHGGHYKISMERSDRARDGKSTLGNTSFPLAINAPVEESELESLDALALKDRMGDANYRWIARDEPISMEGAQVRGRDIWKYLIQLVLISLLLEMLILAWPSLASRRATEVPA